MRKIATPPGMNARLLEAIGQELQPIQSRQEETERYLRRFRPAGLPQAAQQRILQSLAVPAALPYRRPYRRLAAACAAVVLLCGGLAGVLLYPPDTPAAVAEPPAVLLQTAYSVRDAQDGSVFTIQTPVVFVADDVL
ncbi:MAG: hypothetical protein Q4F30_05880 [Akkermansia sp.]|nr:hypothetical protein [Akkermansia sp.]